MCRNTDNTIQKYLLKYIVCVCACMFAVFFCYFLVVLYGSVWSDKTE